MAKTKTPFFSMGAQGSVGKSITTQRRGTHTLVREHPLPTDPYSLPQAYQRWLYEDYAYLWTQQSAATRQAYASGGVRFHLTGFQYWMKYQLKYLPDIMGMWHLDEKAGATAIDFSRQSNDGTIFGASPSVGLIHGSQLFDGINDRIVMPKSPSLNNLTVFTIEFLYRHEGNVNYAQIYYKTLKIIQFIGVTGRLYVNVYAPTVAEAAATVGLSLNTWYHICVTYDDTGDRKPYIWRNGSQVTYAIHTAAVGALLDDSPFDVWLGLRPALDRPLEGRLDHLIIYNRILDATEILRHSLRGYPS